MTAETTFQLPTEYYGDHVFNDKAMRQHLPKAVYKSLKQTMEKGEYLDPSIADIVASAIKDWATAKGATHYTHVFYPLTGNSAEKHDSFIAPDEHGGALAEFSGNMLVQGEADGSSLPSGGLRSTFEARGYTAWDVTSPAYLMENAGGVVLCIPTLFLSWTSLALDKKTPLLRSNQALSKQALRVLKLFGVETELPISSNGGLEQEYFLINRDYVMQRPDLMVAGRTLFGAKPPKGQEFEDQYFGVIPDRVLTYMVAVEKELYKLGVPIKTRHNEVAPSQYEVAPIFEQANLATDHNQLIMTVLRRVARSHGLTCLLHEKPFQGLNGSGKHLNYSIGNREVGNLFDPGDTPHENAKFLVFLCAVIRGVHKYGGFLRASVASASNDFRLGAHEAPPSIMSLFLGDQLSDVLEQFRIGNVKSSRKKRIMNVGVDTLPQFSADAGDRNRTSPFAFVGNRFEFRAVGSLQSPADSIVVLNAMLSEALDFVATFLEREMQKEGVALGSAVQQLIAYIVEEHSAVLFNGDGYSQVWHQEAERRELPIYPHTPDALPVYTHPDVVDLCTRYNILTKEELRARQDIYLEQYTKTVKTEAKLAVHMARTLIYPAAMRYQTQLAKNIQALAACNAGANSANHKVLGEVSTLINQLDEAIRDLQLAIDVDPVSAKDREIVAKNLSGNTLNVQLTEAEHCRSVILPNMQTLRGFADTLETVVSSDLWPLPSYQNMLFVK